MADHFLISTGSSTRPLDVSGLSDVGYLTNETVMDIESLPESMIVIGGGPQGPTIDSPSFMRGSLVHDALYQLMRAEKLDGEIYRKPADRLLQQMCIHDGMSSFRAWIVYRALRFGGGSAADPARKKQPVKAPDFANVENGGE